MASPILFLLRKRGGAANFVSRMVGVKMGDRLAQVGCANGADLGAIAAGVGLSGRAVAIVQDAAAAARATKGAADAGVLVDIETGPTTQLPVESDAFDVVVVDDTARLFAELRAEDRVATVRELLRILRPGGRVMVVGAGTRNGLGALFSRAQTGPPFDPVPSLLADGFKSARTLADRDGYVFVEALKPR